MSRTSYFYLLLGLLLLTLALVFVLSLFRREPTPKGHDIYFVEGGQSMPYHTKFYEISLHGGGGQGLPADRETYYITPLAAKEDKV
ncbi:MAG: hypothetical protein FWE69_06325 [Clostridiales bacterium]|nr:hypothetical protein [Clostridiales bacterium]